MNKIVLIFDYFKEAFHTNKKNKSLYKPQIALIAARVFLMLLVGVGVYRWIGVGNITSMSAMRSEEILGFMFSQGFKLLAIMLVYALISVIIESGLLNMYKKAVTQGYTEPGDFKEGLSKYFLKLLLGEILIILCYIPLLPFYLILGIVTLTVGLTVIPIVIGVFLTMWKISLVMNDIGIFAAAKDSFGFAKRNFIPLSVLQIIHWAFIHAASGGGGGGGGNISNVNNFNNDFNQGYNNDLFATPAMEEIIKIIKIVFAILLPIISIAIIAASVIVMIFEVFFSLTLFVAYKNDFKVEEKQIALLEESTEVETLENQEAVETNITEVVDNQSDEVDASDKEVEQ